MTPWGVKTIRTSWEAWHARGPIGRRLAPRGAMEGGGGLRRYWGGGKIRACFLARRKGLKKENLSYSLHHIHQPLPPKPWVTIPFCKVHPGLPTVVYLLPSPPPHPLFSRPPCSPTWTTGLHVATLSSYAVLRMQLKGSSPNLTHITSSLPCLSLPKAIHHALENTQTPFQSTKLA
jgi:hypothetical protein